MRILVAEDDAALAEGVSQTLRHSGHAVDWVKNGAEADSVLAANQFDLLILDLGLPKKSGLDVLKRLRTSDSRLPVLILTALDGVSDRVRGLDAGADDYLAKPFSPRELEYRVEALLRRGQGIRKNGNDDRLEIGDLVVDRRRHEVSRAGAKVDLTPLEFQILDLLASEPGRAWSRNDLLDRVWSTEYEGYQRNIDPHINRLRKKLEADPKNPHYVLTVRGVGYKLNENP